MTRPHQVRPSNVPDGLLRTERRNDRLVAGVCSGIAARYRVDPLLVRLAFVLLGLSLGVGIVLYAFCALWMTEEGATQPWIHQQVPSSRNWPWAGVIVTLVIACIIGMVVLGSFFPFGPMPALILLGVWLWARRAERRAAGDPHVYFVPGAPASVERQVPLTRFDSASMAWRSRLEAVYLSDAPLPVDPPEPMPVFDPYSEPEPTPAAAAVPATRRDSRRPSWLATLLMWVLAATAFTAVYYLAEPVTEHRWMLPSAAALAVVGLSLVVGAFGRRPRLAVVSGLVLVATMFSSFASPHLEPIGPSGTQTWSAVASVPETLELRYRQTTLDLSALEPTEDMTISVDATASSVTILPPPSAVIEYRLQGGVMKHRGKDIGGGSDQGTIDLRRPGSPTVTLHIVARATEVVVP
ncbi:PspC domain-containing protein [Propionibacteriaceae bacterium Y1923]|uniref:PspC domain-containing protein n=1 Tax=Aestuariimicrobium sp. Y1814 TaxID=3418742 RepID=UPI003C249191